MGFGTAFESTGYGEIASFVWTWVVLHLNPAIWEAIAATGLVITDGGRRDGVGWVETKPAPF
jgi:hypothetical protein